MSELGRWFLIGTVGVLGASVIGVWLFVAVRHPRGAVVAAILLTSAVAVSAYRLVRGSLEITLDNGDVEWDGAFLRGKTPVSTLIRVRPSRITGPYIQVIERSNGYSIVIWAKYGKNNNFRAFCSALQERNPSLDIRSA